MALNLLCGINSSVDLCLIFCLMLVGGYHFRTTILLWIIWSAAAFAYYGIVLMSAELFETQGQLCSLDGKVGALSAICS